MKKLITFSLWGDNPKYCVGAVRNAQLAQEIYPDWTCRFYVAMSIPPATMSALYKEPNTEVVWMDTPGDWRGMFWRFEPASEDDVDVFISRDCDSRLSAREAAAVQEWLDSPYLIHAMRDHPHHTTPILGGMWGAKRHAVPDMQDLMTKWNQEDRWQTDQEFLRDVIWARYRHKVLAHDNWQRFETPAVSTRPFPTGRDGNDFVGSIIGAHEERLHPEHHAML